MYAPENSMCSSYLSPAWQPSIASVVRGNCWAWLITQLLLLPWSHILACFGRCIKGLTRPFPECVLYKAYSICVLLLLVLVFLAMNCIQPTTIGMGVVFCKNSSNPVGSLVPSIHMLLATCMQRPLSLCVLSTCSLLLRTTGETCSNGFPGLEARGVCCTSGCPQCGGRGCGSQAQSVGLSASDCCAGRITSAGVLCSDSGMAPCIIDGV